MIKNAKFNGDSQYWGDSNSLDNCIICGRAIYIIYNEEFRNICKECLQPIERLAQAGAMTVDSYDTAIVAQNTKLRPKDKRMLDKLIL